MDAFVGKWQLTKSNNFDEYLSKLNVGAVLRTIANTTKPVQEISVCNGETTIKTSTTLKSSEIKFKLDEEFNEKTADDKTVKSIVTKESDTKFVQIQKRDFESKITRELVGEEYVMTLEYNGVVATRTYARVK